MHLLKGLCVSLLAVASVVVAQEDFEAEPIKARETNPEFAVQANAQWPDTNPFGHVVNGEKNALSIFIENVSDKNVTLLTVGGEIYQPEGEKPLKTLPTLTYGMNLIEGVRMSIPYSFYSEFKPGDLRLNIWLEHLTDNEKYRTQVYDSIVTIVEPESSWFDYKLISTYLIAFTLLGSLGYFAYLTFVPQPKKKPIRVVKSEPIEVNASGYQEEWIPEHHIKKPKISRRKTGEATSGGETSGGETSGTEGKIRRRK